MTDAGTTQRISSRSAVSTCSASGSASAPCSGDIEPGHQRKRQRPRLRHCGGRHGDALTRSVERRRSRLDRRAVSPPHSHSIINSFCKPMIDRANTSSLAGFTVRCTATATGIPACSIQHRSTSIENSRRLHDGQLSRSIGIYRLPATSATASTRVHLGQRHAQERLASRAVGYCSDALCSQFFLPSGASIKARSEVSTEALACMTVCASAIR